VDVEQAGELEEHVAPAGGRPLRPLGEGGDRGRDRPVDLQGPRHRHGGERLTGGRVELLAAATGRVGLPAVADERVPARQPDVADQLGNIAHHRAFQIKRAPPSTWSTVPVT
jgi:hypothetical protein